MRRKARENLLCVCSAGPLLRSSLLSPESSAPDSSHDTSISSSSRSHLRNAPPGLRWGTPLRLSRNKTGRSDMPAGGREEQNADSIVLLSRNLDTPTIALPTVPCQRGNDCTMSTWQRPSRKGTGQDSIWNGHSMSHIFTYKYIYFLKLTPKARAQDSKEIK